MDLRYEIIDNKYFNIKDVLRGEFRVSSRLYLKLRNTGKIYLNGSSNFLNQTLSLHDVIEVDLGFDEESESIVSTNIDFEIIYEDDYLLVVNKSPNLAVHPSMSHFKDSLSNGVKYYFESVRSKEKN